MMVDQAEVQSAQTAPNKLTKKKSFKMKGIDMTRNES